MWKPKISDVKLKSSMSGWVQKFTHKTDSWSLKTYLVFKAFSKHYKQFGKIKPHDIFGHILLNGTGC